MRESNILIAGPKGNIDTSHLETDPDELDIYLGELASGAFQCLTNLQIQNQIRPLEATDLKFKCRHLVSLIKKIQKNCLHFEDTLAELSNMGRRISSALRHRDEFPDGFETEADNLRKDTLRAENNTMEIEYNLESLNYQINALEEEKKMLSKEATKYPDAEEIEGEIDVETVERQKFILEARRIHRQWNDIEAEKDDLFKQLSEEQQSMDSLTAEYESIQLNNQKVKEENVKIEKDLQEERIKSDKCEEEIKQLIEKQSNLEKIKSEIETESKDLTIKNARLQDALAKITNTLSKTKRTCQELEEEEKHRRNDICKLKMDMKHLGQEKQQYLVSTNQVIKSGAISRKLERQGNKKIKHLEETIKYLEGTHSTYGKDLEMIQLIASKQDLKKLHRLRSQINQLTRNALEQNEFVGQEEEEIRELMKFNSKLLTEVDKEKRLLSDLHRLVSLKSNETTQKKRYLRKTQLHHMQIKRDIKIQQFQLNDHKKTLNSLERQLVSFNKLYKAINVERNECLQMINLAQQKKLMIEEKCTFYNNELTILETGLSNKQDQLEEVVNRREKLKNEMILVKGDLSKQNQINQELESQLKYLNINLNGLNQALKLEKTRLGRIQGEIKAVNKKCEHKKHQLDDLGCELKQNQKNLGKLEIDGKTSRDALSAKTRELSMLQHENQMETRAIDVIQLKIAAKDVLTTELTNLKTQISETRRTLRQLEDIADYSYSSPDFPDRIRLLEGSDPSLEELESSEKNLVTCLRKKDAQVKANNSVLSMINTLVDDLSDEVEMTKGESLQLAEYANKCYRMDQRSTLRMKAACAELRMKILQANVLKHDLENMHKEKGEKPCKRKCRKYKQDKLLRDASTVEFYASEIISQLTIKSIRKYCK